MRPIGHRVFPQPQLPRVGNRPDNLRHKPVGSHPRRRHRVQQVHRSRGTESEWLLSSFRGLLRDGDSLGQLFKPVLDEIDFRTDDFIRKYGDELFVIGKHVEAEMERAIQEIVDWQFLFGSDLHSRIRSDTDCV